MTPELYQLDFDFAWRNKAYNASVFIDINKLELLKGAKTYEEIKRVASYMFNELLDWNITEITRADNDITLKYSWLVSDLVWLIIWDNTELIPHFPDWKFQYKVNSLQKITLH